MRQITYYYMKSIWLWGLEGSFLFNSVFSFPKQAVWGRDFDCFSIVKESPPCRYGLHSAQTSSIFILFTFISGESFALLGFVPTAGSFGEHFYFTLKDEGPRGCHRLLEDLGQGGREGGCGWCCHTLALPVTEGRFEQLSHFMHGFYQHRCELF